MPTPLLRRLVVPLFATLALAAGGAQGGIATPELPRLVPSYPPDLAQRPCTVRPTTSGLLQDALNANARVICLPMGRTFVGTFVVWARSSRDTGWSVLRADTSLTAGQRITGKERLPRLVAGSATLPVLAFRSRSSRWLVEGVEITTDSTLPAGPHNLVVAGEFPGERTVDDLPRDIHFSHINVHGWLLQDVQRGLVLNGAAHVVRDSRCTEIHRRNADSHCTISWNGTGPFLIENNLLEAASENIMWGGGDPAIPGLVPCDITVRGNLIRKPVAWKAIGTPTQSGSYNVKLLYESKNSCRSLVEANRLDGSWLDGQTGYGIGIKSVNQDGRCRWCRTVDLTIRNNVIVNVGAAFGIAGAPEKFPVDSVLSRILVTGNWIDSLNVPPYTGDARGVLLLSRARDVSFVRNTWAGGNWSREAIVLDLSGSSPAVTNFRFDDNVLPIGVYGVGATAAGEGSKALTAAVAGSVSFARNTFIGAERPNYPQTTRWAPTLAAALGTGAGTRRPALTPP
ncbi:MAG: right-handed parallel beta-helix repeat-containing protein [Gemmatimonadaceae bacterium]